MWVVESPGCVGKNWQRMWRLMQGDRTRAFDANIDCVAYDVRGQFVSECCHMVSGGREGDGETVDNSVDCMQTDDSTIV